MDISSSRVSALLVTAGLLATACTSSTATLAEPVAASTAVAPTSTGSVAQDLQVLLTNLADGYRSAEGVWPGFVPNDHPVVLAIKNDDDVLTGALAINHPAPAALGDAATLSTEGTPFTSLHMVQNPTDASLLQNVVTFEFNTVIGGIDSFLMNVGGSDDFFDPTTKDYVSTLLHEMFHRYQGVAFTGDRHGQDVDGYAYTPENLELAVLEERALAAAVNAETIEDRTINARHFAAIRLARLAGDPRVTLDASQEIGEGTARYVEHALAGTDTSYVYHQSNFGDDLVTDVPTSGVKELMGFGRWYASGAAVLHLLDTFAVDGFANRVEAGEGPASILTEALGVTSEHVNQLVTEARAAHDPDDELRDQAIAGAKTAQGEPPVFGDDTTSNEDPSTADAADGQTVSEEELECLDRHGVNVEESNVEITNEVFESCLSAR